MIIPILIVSISFFAAAFLVTENNAKDVLAGYNTMSEEERQKFDLKVFIPLFRKFHIFLGISTFVFSTAALYLLNEDWLVLTLVVYPLLAYMYLCWKGNKKAGAKTKKQKISTIVCISIMIISIVFFLCDFLAKVLN